MSDPKSNLAALLWRAADASADRPTVIEPDRTVTLGELRSRAGAYAEALLAAGVQPGDHTAIFLERGADAVAAIFGAYATGAIAVVLNERYRPRQIEHILHHCGARVFVASQEMLDRQHRDLEISATLVDPANVAASASFDPHPRISPDLAQIIYTSGSTGLPKGVVFSTGALRAGIAAVSSYLELMPEDRVATLMPFSSVYGLNQVLTAIAVGASVVIQRTAVPHQIVTGLAERGTTVLAAVPPLWIQLLGVPDFVNGALSSLRIAQNAGGHLPPEITKRVRAALPRTRLFLQYGMTETFRGTYLPPEEVDRLPGSMGRPMPDTEILVLDENEQPVAVGEVGELVHRGPTIAVGYWNDPEATARIFRPNPLRPAGAPDTERVVFSGDMVRRDAEGFLHFVGRADRVIKTMGFRIGPDEVADVLFASGEIGEVVIDARPDPERGSRIIAYVVLREGGSIDKLKRFVRAEAPEYAVPSEYIQRDSLPRLPSNKYDLEALRKREADA